ncbi:MAG: molybdopterin-guanine dinucleotide biosynthesis protein B [Syntrophomonadaceae bacterium]|nr:molybdopterin-guanine dinucleotide biosynthesis protein B [Syntrophomonadaceae bacterium]
MKVFSVVGYSGSGKTTAIEKIIVELRRRQYSVGTIKEIHMKGFTMDKEGTNTSRHKKAGAQVVTARGFSETNILFPGRLPVERILAFYDSDYVIMEGVSDFQVPKVICGFSQKDIQEKMDNMVFAISGIISNILTAYGDIPVFNPFKDIEPMVDCIEEKAIPWKPASVSD